ncbi:MAG: UDP-3-O-(3-hydroxymyristoyl)glucosamine N-acyltransferase [Desulfamplus sp.]|nr:UDP-3-O-(3-hydroxymyristoyl)glucosamine N-acyltransferase [Desulfamplus sp.]
MKLTLREIAQKIDGKVIGDETLEIYGVSSFYDAGENDITFASDAKFLKALHKTNAKAIIVPEDFNEKYPEYFDINLDTDEKSSKYLDINLDTDEKSSEYLDINLNTMSSKKSLSLIKTQNPKRKFFRILTIFYPTKKPSETIANGSVTGSNFIAGSGLTIGSHVTIGDNVKIGQRVHIMHGVYIDDDVIIGDDTIIKPNVTIMERTVIGSRVIINSGTVLGSDGFGFTQETAEDGCNEKIPHTGFVRIDDDVEIGACNTIDRGTFGQTWIGKGVKTDNLVHIAHNVTIGEHSLIVAQVGIAGSSIIGKRVILAGKVGISGHLTVGDGAIVGPGAGVLSDVKPGHIVSGVPAMPHKIWLKVASILPTLPELRKKILSFEKKLAK